MNSFWRRLISRLLILALAVALCPAALAAQGAKGYFYLAAVTAKQVVFEPEPVAFQSGQTLRQALLACGHSLTGLEQGFVSAVDGVAENYYLYYDQGAYDLDAPASSASGVLLTTAETGWSSDTQALLVRMGQYRQMENGVQNYPGAQTAYASALAALQAGDTAGAKNCLAVLNQAIQDFDELLNGPKAIVTFHITQGQQTLTQAHIALTGVYGDSHTAVGSSISVIPGDYRFSVSDGGCNRTEGTVEVGDNGAAVRLTLPSGQWFGAVDILTASGGTETYEKKAGGVQGAQFYIPDTAGTADTFLRAQQGPDVPDAKTTRLRMCYIGVDGTNYSETNKSWNSTTAAMANLIQPGMEGRAFFLIGCYEDAQGYAMIQSYQMELLRVPTLSSLVVSSDGIQLPLAFSPQILNYQLETITDTLTVAPVAFEENGYHVSVNGINLNAGDTATLQNPSAIIVVVRHDQGQQRTYQIAVTKREAVSVTLEHGVGIAVQVFNAAGAEIAPEKTEGTARTYVLTPGEDYTYRTTQDTYYHTSESFTASRNLHIKAASPVRTDWLTALAAANGTTAAKLQSDPYPMDKAFVPSTHSYTVTVSDCNSVLGLWATASANAGDVSLSASYTRRSDGQEKTIAVTSDSQNGRMLSGFVEVSGYGNQAVLRIARSAGSVQYYQDYILQTSRSLHAYEMGLTADGASIAFKGGTGFDRDRTAYTAELPQGIMEVDLLLQFPKTAQGVGTYGGYSANITIGESSQHIDYVHETPVTVQLSLDPNQQREIITVQIRHPDQTAAATSYSIVLEKLPPVTVNFRLSPVQAVLNLYDTSTGRRAWPNENGNYALLQGHTYGYTVSCAGYVAQSGSLAADRSQTMEVALDQAPVNGELQTDLEASWPGFRPDEDNNGIISTALPQKDEEALLYWASKLGESYSAGAVGAPILVDGYVYTYAGNTLFKVDTISGEIVAQGTMDHSSSFAINPPTYAEGMIFVGLSNGGIQAFNAKTLESLWLYTDPLGGQPNCPIIYRSGYLYTGFWNGESMTANFVCLTATDEDPDQELEAKTAVWTYASAGGFYWAGACVRAEYLLIGTDDGAPGYTTGHASLLSLDPKTGLLLDSLQMPQPGDIRCSIVYDQQTDAFYFTSKGGYFYGVQVLDSGAIQGDSLRVLPLDNGSGSASTPPMSTSSPTVYQGRAYIGVSGKSQFSAYSGHHIAVLDLEAWQIAYQVPTQGYPQTGGLLTTAYQREEGAVYVYFFDNYTPGKLRMLQDRPGQTAPSVVTQEQYTAGGKDHTVEAAYALFTPSGAQAQYAICSPIVDEYGTLYFKNDSAYLMAVGSTIARLQVTRLPEKTRYMPGEIFDATGMVVTAYYTNGTARDVTDYVSYSEEPLTQADTELQITFPYVLYQNREGQSGVAYDVPVTSLDLRLGTATEDELAAEAVEQTIDAIVFPVIEESKQSIDAARAAYDALTEVQKLLVRNYDRLVQAEADYAALTHSHTFDGWSSNGNGTHSRTCSCGAVETEPCSCSTEVLREADCTEKGMQRWTCTLCAWQTEEETPPLGHTWGDWQTEMPATCFADGTELQTCSRCGRTQERRIPANSSECPSATFSDVNLNLWYHEGIDYVVAAGLMNGTGKSAFSPDESMTRGQLVTVLYRQEGAPAVSGSNPFTDVQPGRYYTEAVQWAADHGIVTGTTATRFNPEGRITREQIATILFRYVQYKGMDTTPAGNLDSYPDGARVSAYAKTAMSWAVGSGLIQGVEGNRLVPQNSATRAQVATILMRFCKQD